jgi:uncharacterized protein
MAATAEASRTARTGDGGQAVVVRPAVPVSERLADPAAVGLAGFGLSTFMLSMINVGWISLSAQPVVFGVALAYGGIMQLLAGMWAFVKRDTFAAVALSSYGAFWISFWALNAFFIHQIPASEQADALGLYLISWGVFTGYMFLVSLRVSVAVALVFATLTATYLLLGIGKADDSTGLFHLGGAFGIATALLAWYVSFAITMNRTVGRELLPLRHLGGAPGDA